MNDLQQSWFQELREQRSMAADALESFGLRGLKKGASDNYSDKAHFVYELLQNADDAGATSVTFHLCSDRLIFVHNGTRRFTISNPKTEAEDKDRNRLGDVNSITAYHESTKSDNGLNSIGTFGIGFKAVYLYTREPAIYDGEINFAIEREMVPRVIDGDIPERRKGETAFVLPFNHPEVSAAQANKEIAAKLKGLSYPLLFLNNLREIRIRINDSANGRSNDSMYSKKVTSLGKSGSIIQERIELLHAAGDSVKPSTEILVVFSRVLSDGHRCSVGYFMDKKEKLVVRARPAFCFFPTHVKTGLGFVIQAPFQLTNSREVIVASDYNVGLIDSLAKLAADSLTCLTKLKNSKGAGLLDDGIINIVPTDPDDYGWESEDESLATVSFEPFYDYIEDAFSGKKILPARSGYVTSEHAYWAATREISELFDDAQLQMLSGDKKARWVFCSKPAGSDDASMYIREFASYVDDFTLLSSRRPNSSWDYDTDASQRSSISASFIEAQSHGWLSRFYGWVSETQQKIDAAKDLPILLDSFGKACSAYNSESKRELYLPAKVEISGYRIVADWIPRDKNGSTLLKKFEICPPNAEDIIYHSIVLPLEASKDDPEVDEEEVSRSLRFLYDYYRGMPRGKKPAHNEYFKRLADCYIIPARYPDGSGHFYCKPNEAYFANDLLSAYFSNSEAAFFVDTEKSAQILGTEQVPDIESFLSALGVASSPRIIDTKLGWYEAHEREDLPKDKSTYMPKWVEPRIDGLDEALSSILETRDKEKSLAIWKVLEAKAGSLDRLFEGTYTYFYYQEREKHFESSSAIALRKNPWLFSSKGEIKSPANIAKRELDDIYGKGSAAGKKVMAFLGIRDSNLERLASSGKLTDEDANDIGMALFLRENGIQSKDELRELLEIKKQRDAAEEQRKAMTEVSPRPNFTPEDDASDATERRERTSRDTAGAPDKTSRRGTPNHRPSGNGAGSNISGDFGDSDDSDQGNEATERRVDPDYAHADWHTLGVSAQTASQALSASGSSKGSGAVSLSNKTSPQASVDAYPQQTDSDEDIDESSADVPFRGINYDNAISRAQKAGDHESQQAWSMKILHDVAISSEKYTYAWFASLLRLEALAEDDPYDSRAVSIRFGLVEAEPGTKRTLCLRQPNTYIPQRMEELSDIPLVLHMADGDRRITIEVASVLSDRLKAKVKDPASIRGIDFKKVVEASINVQSPAFLLQSLISGFESLGLADDFNLKSGLGENIEFVFGPPGTGKTTYLAREFLIPLMKTKERPRVLVLAPTNKAADVLTSKVMEVMHDDTSWKNWLARFGVTADEQLERSGVFRDRDFDFDCLKGIVGISTIARFAYDYITIGGDEEKVQELDWDYVIVDEASMVSIANISYLLYKANPKKFIIAGDPYQIEPVDAGNFWQGENIYSMVGLRSFTNPRTEPHEYKVHTLSMQYRSVPAIGDVVSELTYGGGLIHNRSVREQGVFPIARDLEIAALNIVRFPVRDYEGIYRAKRLGKSPYHIYSALLAFEFVKRLANEISATKASKKPRSIGVITPYRAQADLIESLILQGNLPMDVQVLAGTIHSFQGDECDIVVAVFNPPTSLGPSGQFLNKESIVNVAISRARDYLVLFVPDDATKGFAYLKRIRKLIRLCQVEGCWEYSSAEVEQALFGDEEYLEKNVFSTSHQSVNVYRQPERRYEVRVSDEAVDVQVSSGR